VVHDGSLQNPKSNYTKAGDLESFFCAVSTFETEVTTHSFDWDVAPRGEDMKLRSTH